MSRYYVENFGCRATQADGAALERQFQESGLSRASTPAEASVVVMNTCTVTSGADHDARAAIRRVRRQNPDAQIVVTGCYAQRAPEELASLPGVSVVVGNSHKHQLAEIVRDFGWRSAAETEPQGNAALAAEAAFVPLASLASQNPRPIFVSDIFAHTELLAAPVFDAANERTRPNLKVQDGCDNRCSFCVIPFVRGHSRSLPLYRILEEVKGLVASGYREVVISGINLGRWGRDLAVSPATSAFSPQPSAISRSSDLQTGRLTSEVRGLTLDWQGSEVRSLRSGQRPATNDQQLESLIRAILNDTSVEKLRISSVEPMDWSDELISLLASSPRIAKHAHVPLQSASDAVLRRMHRKYRPWHYREKIEKIHAAMPSAAIGADVMVGFPGETDTEFEATRRLIVDLPFTYLHVFTYSPRPGTPAAEMKNQVPAQIARERNRILRELGTQKKLAFMRSFIGREIEAITLRSDPSSGRAPSRETAEGDLEVWNAPMTPFTEALTDNYLKLRLEGNHAANRWLRAHVEDVRDGALLGTA